MQNTIYPLFPAPLVVCGDLYEFDDAENAFFSGLEMVDNIGNLVSANDRVLDADELVKLRAFIDARVLNFKKNLLQIKDDNEIYVTQSWVNSSMPGQYHPRHRHQNSILSGVIYLDGDDTSDLPPIRFHRRLDLFSVDFSYDGLNEFNSSSREFDPVAGMLMLFPSGVEHSVEKNQSENIRRSLSFNTFVRGPVGGKAQLTELNLL